MTCISRPGNEVSSLLASHAILCRQMELRAFRNPEHVKRDARAPSAGPSRPERRSGSSACCGKQSALVSWWTHLKGICLIPTFPREIHDSKERKGCIAYNRLKKMKLIKKHVPFFIQKYNLKKKCSMAQNFKYIMVQNLKYIMV